MAGISTSIGIQDSMTPVFRNLVNVMETVIGRFERMERASHSAVDTADLTAARQSLAQINSSIDMVEANINQAVGYQRQMNDAIIAGTSCEHGMEEAIRHSTSSQSQFNSQIQRGDAAASGLAKKISGFVSAYVSIAAVRQGVHKVGNFLQAADAQIVAERKLETVMSQRMNANEEMIQSVKNLLSEQQNLGIIGDEVAMAGAQQLATFLNTDSALKTLIPAMENLGAQQKDYGASAQGMVSLGNMMGKAMQGQVAALQRVGITFSDSQANMLKYGDEAQRAATLAEVITQNTGNMNAALLATPGGQITNMKNAWGDMKEVIGFELYPAAVGFFDVVRNNIPQIQGMMTTVAGGVASVINVATLGLQGLSNASNFMSANWSTVKPVLNEVTTAITGVIFAIGAYKTAAIAMNTVDGISAIRKALQTASIDRAAAAAARQAAAVATLTGTTAANTAAETAGTVAENAHTAATKAATATQTGLNFAILSNPLFWMAAGVIVVIGVLTALHIKNNGLKASILQLQNAALTAWDMMKISAVGMEYIITASWNALKISAMSTGITVVTNFENMKLGVKGAFYGILNFIGDTKAKGLMLLQDFLNGSIDAINRFTSSINNIAGTSFESISHITIGTNTEIHEKAERAARTSAFEIEKRKSEAKLAGMNQALDIAKANAAQEAADLKNKQDIMLLEANDKAAARQRAIDDAIKEHKAGKNSLEDLLKFDQNTGSMMDSGFDEEMAANMGKTAENTSRMADSMLLSDNLLSLLRDSAERRYMDKTVTIKVDMINNNTIHSDLDLDGITSALVGGLEQQLAVMAEGGHI